MVKKYPSRISISAGIKCNNNCLFCFQRNNTNFNLIQSSNVIKEHLFKFKDICSETCFGNFEPTLRDDLPSLIAYAKECGYREIILQTNGRMLSSMSYCKNIVAAGCTTFAISIHGANSKMHDLLTRANGSFAQAIQGLRNIKSLGKAIVSMTTINKSNFKHLKEISLMLLNLGVYSQSYMFVDPSGNALSNFYKVVPRISLVIPYIREMIDAVKSYPNISISIKAIPFCMMSGYEDYIKEYSDEMFYIEKNLIENVHQFRSVFGKVKFPKCKNCKFNSICEGIWKEYPLRYGNDEFIPVASVSQTNKFDKSKYLKSLSISSLNDEFSPIYIRIKALSGKYLIVTDTGFYSILTSGEMEKLHEPLDSTNPLYKKLVSDNIIISSKNKPLINKLLCKDKKSYDGVRYHTIVITECCNLGCVYCQASSNKSNLSKKSLSKSNAKKIIDFIFNDVSKDTDEITIEFQGGEPLLRFDIIKFIVNYANKLNISHNKTLKFNIGTNLTLLDDDKINFIVKEHIQVATSIDGPSIIHDSQRPYKGGYPNLEHTLKCLKKLNFAYSHGEQVFSSPTFTNKSLSHFKEIVNFYVSNNLTPIQSRFIDKIGSGGDVWASYGYTIKEYVYFFEKYLDYLLELNKAGIKIKDRSIVVLLSNIFRKEMLWCLGEECHAITSSLVYDTNGDIYPCEYWRFTKNMKYKLANIDTAYFSDILSKKQTKEIIKNNSIFNSTCAGCIWKPFCGVCVFRREYEGGSLNSSPHKTTSCLIQQAYFKMIFEKIISDENNLIIFKNWLDWS